MDSNGKLPILNAGSAAGNSRAGVAYRGLSRREMVQRLLGTAGVGLAAPGIAVAESVHPVHKHMMSDSTMARAEEQAAVVEWKPLFLDPHQNETLIVLAERIVPNSTNAQVNRFIDLLLSVDTFENQRRFINALSAFEAEALKRHSSPFKSLTEDQQNEILTFASTAKPAREESPVRHYAPERAESPESGPDTIRDHFNHLKEWISGAYYSSEVGMKELGWTGQMMWESFPGCQHPEGHT